MTDRPAKRLRTAPLATPTGAGADMPNLLTTRDSTSPYMPMFEGFRASLDEHHDRRDRMIKASRDVTATSKKIIFALQRVRQYGTPLPPTILKEIKPLEDACLALLTSLVPDLQGINAWRYQRQVSGGIQEFLEAMVFSHYLQHRHIIDMSEAQEILPSGIRLTEEDWLGGVMDSVGECMRWAITGMASKGQIPGDAAEETDTHPPRNIAQDLRELRVALETLRANGSAVGKDFHKKMDVMKTSVNKVESSAYGLIVRGQERPKGWVPAFNEAVASAPERD